MKLLDELPSLGFVELKDGKSQSGTEYSLDGFSVYELGEFLPGQTYSTLVYYHDSKYININSNCNWIGDPSMMGSVFIGKIETIEELKTLLKQLGIDYYEVNRGLEEFDRVVREKVSNYISNGQNKN